MSRSAEWLARVMGATGLAGLALTGVMLVISVQQIARGRAPTLAGVTAALVCTVLAAGHFLAAAELASGAPRGARVAAALAVLELVLLGAASAASFPLRNDAAVMAAVVGATLTVELGVALSLSRRGGAA